MVKGNPLPQFPQPTRPEFSYDPIPPQQFHHPESQPQIPNPSRPVPTSDYEIRLESQDDLSSHPISESVHHCSTDSEPDRMSSRRRISFPDQVSDQEIHQTYRPESRENIISESARDLCMDSEPNRKSSSKKISFPEEAFDQEFRHPESLALPVPISRPESRENITSESEPDRVSSSSDRISFSPSTGKTPKGEKEAVDELLSILLECMEELNTRSREVLLKKFFSEIEREEPLERFIVQRLKQSRVKAISDLCEKLPQKIMDSDARSDFPTVDETKIGGSSLTRSISVSAEELSLKLELFKVKTLDVIVREEASSTTTTTN